MELVIAFGTTYPLGDFDFRQAVLRRLCLSFFGRAIMFSSGRCFVPIFGFLVPTLMASAAALTLSNSLLGQTVTGTLQGTVTDTHGGVLPGAGISVRNIETGLERLSTTNAKGFYRETFLPIGVYRVTASLPGFG